MTSILNRIEKYFEFKTPVIWTSVFVITVIHILALYAITLIPYAKTATITWGVVCTLIAGWGVTGGSHKLWTHKSYKAKLPIRFITMLCYMLTGQYPLVQWVRDHRTHHKFTDTDADPHSAGRGLLFSHCGWLMMKRHPDLKEKGKLIDVSDLWQDPVIRFHQRHFVPLLIGVHIIFPTAVAYFVFGETLKNAIFINFFLRYCLVLNLVWTINSFAHHFGYRPYNKKILASQNNLLAFLTMGEGYHNYHHTFPWDYRIGEPGQSWQTSSRVIEAFAWFGLAYDLKVASPELVRKVREKNLPQNFEVPETGFINLLETVQKDE